MHFVQLMVTLVGLFYTNVKQKIQYTQEDNLHNEAYMNDDEVAKMYF